MTTELSGPMFEPSKDDLFKSNFNKEGAHYNIFRITGGMESLKSIFPDGEANDLNFVLFSTSGVHGQYTTVDEVEESIKKYGYERPITGEDDDYPEDYHFPEITVLIVHPRIVCLRYGNVQVTCQEDLDFLKKLRASSHKAVSGIGL